jgi:hypothetical protein
LTCGRGYRLRINTQNIENKRCAPYHAQFSASSLIGFYGAYFSACPEFAQTDFLIDDYTCAAKPMDGSKYIVEFLTLQGFLYMIARRPNLKMAPIRFPDPTFAMKIELKMGRVVLMTKTFLVHRDRYVAGAAASEGRAIIWCDCPGAERALRLPASLYSPSTTSRS